MKNHVLWYLSPLFFAMAAMIFAGWTSQFNAFRLLAKTHEPRRVIQGELASLTQHLVRLKCPLVGADFNISVSLNENDEITGLGWKASDGTQKIYKLEDLEAGLNIDAPADSPAAYINPVGRLQSIDFHPARGGSIRFEFIKNALTRARSSYEFIIMKDGDRWVAQDAESRQNFSYALLVPNTVAIPFVGKKSVGIAGVSVQPDL